MSPRATGSLGSGSGYGSGSRGPTKGRVLVIEDDRDIALGIRTVLTRSGYDVANSADGKQGLRVFHTARPDLVVLDIGLPTLDGWQVLERIRDLSDVPVLMLTAHGNEADKVRGLHAGADDYLTKPFGNQELAARVEALLRRPRAGTPPPEVYDDGRLLVRLDSREVSVNGTPVALTPIEFRLLAALVRNPGRTLTPDQLLELAWNDPLGIGPERVKFAVMRLRRKLDQHELDQHELDQHDGPGSAGSAGSAGSGGSAGSAGSAGSSGSAGSAIEAVRGFGYRYVVPVAARAPRPREGDPG